MSVMPKYIKVCPIRGEYDDEDGSSECPECGFRLDLSNIRSMLDTKIHSEV